ncbi:MAG: hypothetical protein QG622_862 [Actinomycetota bacterium]|nr:hypothetical protein [Actinomycetota bacterium]
MTVLLCLNTLAALSGAGFALLAVARPQAMSGSSAPTSGERFFASMYAARSIPLGLLAAGLPWATRGAAVTWLLFLAAAIQLLDVAIGVRRTEVGMIIGPTVAAVIHVAAGMAVR